MSLYKNTITNELRELPESYIADLIAAGNPKAEQWEAAPPKPSDDAMWQDGQWVTPSAPVYTAEEWTDSQGYGGNRSTTLLYQKLRLDAAAKSSPKLNAVQGWLDGMIASGFAPASSNWPTAPHTFEETLSETLTILTSP
jgi:hypothetical protein